METFKWGTTNQPYHRPEGGSASCTRVHLFYFILSVQVELAILTATGVKSKWNQSYQNVLLALELWAR